MKYAIEAFLKYPKMQRNEIERAHFVLQCKKYRKFVETVRIDIDFSE